jgi:hypothetical protein
MKRQIWLSLVLLGILVLVAPYNTSFEFTFKNVYRFSFWVIALFALFKYGTTKNEN